MAENAKQSENKQAEVKPDAKSEATNTGTASKEAFASSDLALAEKAGVSEGEVKALRDDAGLNQHAGHEADLHAWSLTEAGKKFAKDAGDREKAEKEAAKKQSEHLNKDGLTKAEAKYREAVKG